jgi:hypothetical protein
VTAPGADPIPTSRARSIRLAGGLLEIVDLGSRGDALERWLPIPPAIANDRRAHVTPTTDSRDAVARIRIFADSSLSPCHHVEPPTLRLSTVRAWVSKDRVELEGASGMVGTIDLTGLSADLTGRRDGGEPVKDLYSVLTLSAAFLLGRMRRALVHAAAFVAPDGRARLVVGDAWSGKSTTIVSLIGAGWDWLSDDQVVLQRESTDEVVAEGWARPFHLDEGWSDAMPTGHRRAVDPAALGPGRRRESAELGGLIFPRVEPEEPTRLDTVPPAEAFAGLVRQSPWLLADRGAAPSILELLRAAALLPAYRLSLGHDTFGRPERLAQRLAVAIAR